MREIIKRFEEEIRPNSPLCKLSLGKTSIQWDNLNCNSIYPFAFIAYQDDNLNKIDAILKEFEIENKGTADFKSRFEDKYFIKNMEAKELKYLNALLSPITELVVADYLSKDGEEIVGLSACSECPSDIKSKKAATEYFTEVKYIGEIPELHRLVRDTIKNNKLVGVGPIGDLGAIYNYVNMRIADTVFQLEGKNIDEKKRRVFVVIKSSEPFKRIVPSLIKKEDWCDLSWNSLINSLGLSQEQANKYLSDTIENYYIRSGKLVVSLMDDSYNLKVEN